MAIDRNLEFIDDLYKKYENKEILCKICNKPIPFKKFILQYTESNLYCSKKCREKDKVNNKSKHFASKTEQAVYVFLSIECVGKKVRHNIKDFIPPYEIDFSIDDTFIEYNGSFHISSKKRGLERKIEKTKLNDKKKKDIICKENKRNLIRVWTEVGLYTRPVLFNKVLKILKQKIEYIENKDNSYVYCVEICVDKDEKIHVFEESFER